MATKVESQWSVSEAVSEKKNNQSKLEEEMVDLGKDRYHHKLKRAKETSLESTTSVGQYLLSESISLMTDAVKSWMASASASPGKRHRAYDLLRDLPPKVIAALTARCILDCISIERKIVSTSIMLGRLLEDELRFRHIREEEPALWQQINRVLDRFKSQKTKSKFINKTIRFHDIVLPSWDRRAASSVGLTCIELLRQSTGMIEIITRRDPQGKSYTTIRPTDELLDWMKNSHDYNEALAPVWLPMVEKPIGWNNPYIGGYQSMTFRRRPLVKTMDRGYLEEIAESAIPEVYSAINTVQETGYTVDGQLAELLHHCWDKSLPVGGIPSMEDDPVPNKPANIGTDKEARRAWRKAAARVHFENERQKSKRLQVMKVLQLAGKFANDTIYFPHSGDFRMRIYPVPYFLQPQGPDWARSLLNFQRSAEINQDTAMWLYIHAASKWGMDKKSFNERANWAEGNIDLIRRIGEDPISEMTWTDAGDPWAFARACMEIARMHNEGSSFRTTLPITMDATNQGLQIYSMILRDPEAAIATNVTPNEVPQDVYQQVADIVRRKLYEDHDLYGSMWLDFGVDRSTTKRSTMTLCYGSTFYACKNYTTEWFYDQLKSGKSNPFGDETYKPCNYLAEKIWESIGEVVESARVGMDWLRECASLFLEHDIIPRWSTPLGFPVKMHYENTNKYAVKTIVGGVMRQHRLRVPNGEINRRKTVNALPPNWIHSLDGIGGLLGAAVNRASSMGVRSVMTCHDSIGVLAPDVENMHRSVREATVEIFSQDQLKILANQFAALLPPDVSLPSLPTVGDLDINDVLDSKYYFN